MRLAEAHARAPALRQPPVDATLARRRSAAPRVWFGALVAAICLEGLGRKFLPQVPSPAWYFLKDGVLLAGLAAFGIGGGPRRLASALYRPFGLVLALAGAVTLVQVFNPAHGSLLLGMLGLRAYWLWWLAPLVVATALRREDDLRAGMGVVAATALIVAAIAAIQFALPGDAAINRGGWSDDPGGVTGVAETGRVRVTSTFSYLTGFTNFVQLVLPLLFAFGFQEPSRRRRTLLLGGAVALSVVLPMSGARSPAIIAGFAAAVVFWASGAFATSTGRRMALVLVAMTGLPVLLSPDAIAGVAARFEYQDTGDRLRELRLMLPPLALLEHAYPVWGIGTGMQQTVRLALGVTSSWAAESPIHRQLIELGALGYLLVWTAVLGLVLALIQAARLLARSGRRAMAGLATVLAGLLFIGNPFFDHVWQALFFTLVGLVLQQCSACAPAAGRAMGQPPLRHLARS